ncbi:MAG: hypothetical protein U0354_13025 [Candidatus Sericytochromatia bacterium]
MVNFNVLREAQSISQILIHDNREIQAEQYFNEGLEYFQAYETSNNKGYLKKAAELFFESIKNKRKQVDSYLYLAHTFHILGNDKLTIKYIKIAELYDPENIEILELKAIIGYEEPSSTSKTIINQTNHHSLNSFSENVKMLFSMKVNSLKNKKTDLDLR